MKNPFLATTCSLALACVIAQNAHAKTLQIFLLTGQSNSLGTPLNKQPAAANSVANNFSTPTTASSQPVADQSPLWFDNFSNLPNDSGDATLGASTAWGTMQAQAGGVYANNSWHWGPEVGFARSMVANGNTDFAVVKASRGGGGNGNWVRVTDASGNVTWNTTGDTGAGYYKLLQTIKAATTSTALSSLGYDDFEVKGLMYLQGESNSAAEANVAATRFSDLINNLKLDLAGKADGMTAVLGQPANIAAAAARTTTWTNLVNLDNSRADIASFNSNDLAYGTDNLHFTPDSQLTLGSRYFNSFLSMGTVVPEPNSALLLALSIPALLRRKRKSA